MKVYRTLISPTTLVRTLYHGSHSRSNLDQRMSEALPTAWRMRRYFRFTKRRGYVDAYSSEQRRKEEDTSSQEAKLSKKDPTLPVSLSSVRCHS